MIKLVVLDFDGVFTDGTFLFSTSGITSKHYNGKDSYALKILRETGIKTGIITNDKVVSLRHAKHIYDRIDYLSMGISDKLAVLNEWIAKEGLTYEHVAYMGDDTRDIPVLEKVGLSACPSDAIPDVRHICSFVATKPGGHGAVREFVDYLLKHKKQKQNMSLIERLTGKRYSYDVIGKHLLEYMNRNTLPNVIQIMIETTICNMSLQWSKDNILTSIVLGGFTFHQKKSKLPEKGLYYYCYIQNNDDTQNVYRLRINVPSNPIQPLSGYLWEALNIKEYNVGKTMGNQILWEQCRY